MPIVCVRRPTNIILDIYGTIASLKFRDELKEFALKNVDKYLKEHWGDRRLVRLLDKIRNEVPTLEKKEGMPDILDYGPKADAAASQKSIVDHINWRVSTGQESQYVLFLWEGVWEDGYKSKELKSHVFEDVPRALKFWRTEQYIKVYTLASGKKKGQHLFLKSTTQGDLVNLIANYLDCSAFGKEDRRCYTSICSAVREKPENLLFVTDNPREAQAALDEKFQVVVIVREGNEPLTEADRKNFNVVTTLDEIQFLDPLPDAFAGIQKSDSLTDLKNIGDDKAKTDTKEKPSMTNQTDNTATTETASKPKKTETVRKPSNKSPNKN